MSNPHFDRLRDLFDQFSKKHLDNEDNAMRLARSLSAGGKAALDQAMTEFPRGFVANVTLEFYALLKSRDFAESLSGIVQSLDEARAKEIVSSLTQRLQEPETALSVATWAKMALNNTSMESLEQLVEKITKGRPADEQMMAFALLYQIRPFLEDMKDAPVEELADTVAAVAQKIPVDAVAAEIAAVTREITPDVLQKRVKDLVNDNLPAADVVAGLAHDLGTSASRHLERLSHSASRDEMAKIVEQFTDEAQTLIKKAFDDGQKPQPPKTGEGRKPGGPGRIDL